MPFDCQFSSKLYDFPNFDVFDDQFDENFGLDLIFVKMDVTVLTVVLFI